MSTAIIRVSVILRTKNQNGDRQTDRQRPSFHNAPTETA